MVSILEAIILGIIQGITEWLPISSSGHLVLFQRFLAVSPPVIFDIILHIGSLIVVLLVFRKEIISLISGLLYGKQSAWRYFSWLLLASIPIGFVGVLFNDMIKYYFDNLLVVGFSFLFTALLLFLAKYPRKKTKKLSLPAVIAIGCAQALAILPGVSRSGSTIAVGLMQGIRRETVAAFSFLLFIPAILGALLVELPHVTEIANPLAAGFGIITTILVGYVSLKLLLRIIKRQKFHYFGWYCLVVGIANIVFWFM